MGRPAVCFKFRERLLHASVTRNDGLQHTVIFGLIVLLNMMPGKATSGFI